MTPRLQTLKQIFNFLLEHNSDGTHKYGGKLLAYQHVAATLTGNTNETTLFTTTIPGGTMGPNGTLDIHGILYANSSANAKTVRLYFGGVLLAVCNFTTGSVRGLSFARRIFNRNATNSQVMYGSSGGSALALSYGDANIGISTLGIDTSVAQTLVITGQLANAADTIRCEAVDVEVLRP